MREEYNSVLLTPTKDDYVLANTDILVKPKYQPHISARANIS